LGETSNGSSKILKEKEKFSKERDNKEISEICLEKSAPGKHLIPGCDKQFP